MEHQFTLSGRMVGKIEASLYGLKEILAGSKVGLRLVGTISEVLEDMESRHGFLYEDMDDLDLLEKYPPLPEEKEEAAGDPPAPSAATEENSENWDDQIRSFGQELLREGCGIREAIPMIINHFYMAKIDFAKFIGISPGTLTKYLQEGRCQKRILTAMAEVFGEDGGAGRGE